MNVIELRINVEKKFLTYLLKDTHYIALSIGNVKPEYFHTYYKVYDMILDYYDKYQGIITIEQAKMYFQTYKIDNDTFTLFQALINELPGITIENNDADFKAIIDELMEFFKKTKLVQMAEKIVDMNPFQCSSHKMEELEKFVNNEVLTMTADNSAVRKSGTLKDSIKEQKDRYLKVKNNPESVTYIPTGFPAIDDIAGGFRYSELIYIIGRKGDGKSVLMLNMAVNMWKAGKNVLLFSLEMDKEDYERRFAAKAAGISSNGIKRGMLEEWEEARFRKYLVNISKDLTPEGNQAGTFYTVDVPSKCSPAFVDSTIDITQKKLGIKFDVVFVDYAGIMVPNIFVPETRHQQGQIALDLKRIARNRSCVVVSAAQMNRKGKNDTNDKNGRADTDHIAESDQVADHIDMGIAIRSVSDTQGVIESFKTRDCPSFQFNFIKEYNMMNIRACANHEGEWGDDV
jgi:replicative DNA helicase